MALFSKLFGLGLVFAGVFIAVYWSVWLLTITPGVAAHFPADLKVFFPPPEWIFRLPAVALIGGIAFISYFINSTSAKIAAAKAEAAAKAASGVKKTA